MNIEATLTSSLGTIDLPIIEVGLSKSRVDMVNRVTTLSNDVFTRYSPNFRQQWEFPYSYMDKATYDQIEAIYYDSLITGYPTLSIPYYDVDDVYVVMELNPMEVIDDCGTIRNIKLSFRETDISSDPGSS